MDISELICQALDPELDSTMAFDTSGIGPYATENYLKHLNRIIKQLQSFYKDKSKGDIHNIA